MLNIYAYFIDVSKNEHPPVAFNRSVSSNSGHVVQSTKHQISRQQSRQQSTYKVKIHALPEQKGCRSDSLKFISLPFLNIVRNL